MNRRTPRTPPEGSGFLPMTIQRLQELLDAYGARSDQWPPGERASALALLRDSDEARHRRNEAARLDAVLARAVVPAPSPGLLDRVVATASDVRLPVARTALRRHPNEHHGPRDGQLRVHPRRQAERRWQSVVAAASFAAAAAAVTLWLARPSETPRDTETPAALAVLGTYSTPTDTLLEAESLSVVDSLPAFGCDDGEWGCPELDLARQHSATDRRRRFHV
jgi:hypothetical protein